MSAENNIEFTLIAYDPETAFSPRRIRFLLSASVGERDDFVWASVDFPLRQVNDREAATSQILLAARHSGYSVNEPLETPMHVYVCNVKEESLLMQTALEPEVVSIMYWAILLPDGYEKKSIVEILEAMTETQGNVYYVNPVHK